MIKDILLIGGGGREHAICQKLLQAKDIGKIYVAPGNAGIMANCLCLDIKATQLDKILEFVKDNPNIYMTVVSPDDPLSMGLVDLLNQHGFKAFGPNKAAAKIEWSKAFSKNLMQKYNIPTAEFKVFDDYKKAEDYLKKAKYPLVIKADGLALGKGVIIAQNIADAKSALKSVMLDKAFGNAGSSVVIEQFLVGKEVSLLAFTDSHTVSLMPSARDFKKALDGDNGLNTGGMGAFSPVPEFENCLQQVKDKIVLPTIQAMNREGCPFKGVLYFGLMVTDSGVKVIEYNARFGDPETQVVLPGLKTNLIDIFDAIIDERLDKINIEWDNKKRVCVVAASSGYPLEYKKGEEIFFGDIADDTQVFHAGTALKDGKVVTNGGRVLCVSAKADTLQQARQKAYNDIDKISFNGKFFRKDIAQEF